MFTPGTEGYEATTRLPVTEKNVVTPRATTYRGGKLKDRIGVVPVLRSGLGMVDSMLRLVPAAVVHHLGVYHDSSQELPVLYYNKLPMECDVDIAFVLEPMSTFAILPPL